MRVSPTTPHGWLLLRLAARLERARATSERGVSTIEWVIITAVLVAVAGAVGIVIYNMVNNAANEIQIPDAPGG
ncbi:MAG TPA: hypothetical protein VFZ37_10840 [Jiangellaceae bacterium]